MFGIGWDLLQPKGNIIAPIVFIPVKKKMGGSFAIKASFQSMLKALYAFAQDELTNQLNHESHLLFTRESIFHKSSKVTQSPPK